MGLKKTSDNAAVSGIPSSEIKKIIFFGNGYEDILLYLAGILRSAGIKTLIKDFTREHRFYSCISHIDGINPFREVLDFVNAYYEIHEDASTYEKNQEINKESRNDKEKEISSDIEIYLFDYASPGYDDDMKNGNIILVTDEHRVNLEAIESSGFNADILTALIIKNYTGVMKKRFEKLLSNIDCKKIFALPLSEKDYKNAILTEQNEKYKFTDVSSEMKKVLEELTYLVLPDIDKKFFKKVYLKAARGGK